MRSLGRTLTSPETVNFRTATTFFTRNASSRIGALRAPSFVSHVYDIFLGKVFIDPLFSYLSCLQIMIIFNVTFRTNAQAVALAHSVRREIFVFSTLQDLRNARDFHRIISS